MQADREESRQSGIFIRWKINSLDFRDLRQSGGDLSPGSQRNVGKMKICQIKTQLETQTWSALGSIVASVLGKTT